MSQKSFTTTTSFIISSDESLNKLLSSSQSATDCSNANQTGSMHLIQTNGLHGSARGSATSMTNDMSSSNNPLINSNKLQPSTLDHTCMSTAYPQMNQNSYSPPDPSVGGEKQHTQPVENIQRSHHQQNETYETVPMIYGSFESNNQSQKSVLDNIPSSGNYRVGAESQQNSMTNIENLNNSNSRPTLNDSCVPLSQYKIDHYSKDCYGSIYAGHSTYSTTRNSFVEANTQVINNDGDRKSKFESHRNDLDVCPLIPMNVKSMLLNGVPDREVIRNWLASIKCEEYLKNFVDHGYDMRTLTKMTPQDLTAIGCKSPAVRKKLLIEIKKLNIDDNIPTTRPESLEKWLSSLRLVEYYPGLCREGYETVDKVCTLTWEDLEEIGIVKLGHQKRLLMGIDKLKKSKLQQEETRSDQSIYDVHPNHRVTLNPENRMSTLSRSTSRSGFFQTRSGANLDRRGLPVATVVPALKHITNPPISSDVTLHTSTTHDSIINSKAINRLSTCSLNFPERQPPSAETLSRLNNYATLKRPPLPPTRKDSHRVPQDSNELLNKDVNNYNSSIYSNTGKGTFSQPMSVISTTSTLRTPKLGTLTATTNKMLTLGGHMTSVNSNQATIRSVMPVREAPLPPITNGHTTTVDRIEEESPLQMSIDSYSGTTTITDTTSLGSQQIGPQEFPPPPPPSSYK